MTPQRPKSVIAIATFNLIFGLFGLLFGLCCGGIGGLLIPIDPEAATARPQADPEAQRMMQEWAEVAKERQPLIVRLEAENAPWKDTYFAVLRVIDFLLPVLLIVSGIGLFRMKSWARWMAIGYAALSLLVGITRLAIWLMIFVAVYNQAYKVVPSVNQVDDIIRSLFTNGITGILVVLLIYPAIVLLVMMLPSVGGAFQGESGDASGNAIRPNDDDQSGWAER